MNFVWITGGGTGIGRALAESFYRDGDVVIISGRRSEVLQKTAAEVKALPGGEIIPIAGDAARPELAQEVVAVAQKLGGTVNRLFNNAGANSYHDFSETPVEEYRRYFENNCLSAIVCSQAVLPVMLSKGSGAIVNISSVYGAWASSHSASYSVAKFALSGFTQVLRQAVIGTPVHVMAVYPGFIKTEMTMPFVRPGSLRSHFGAEPVSIARVVRRGLRRKKSEIYYPSYVRWALGCYRLAPGLMDRLAVWFRR